MSKIEVHNGVSFSHGTGSVLNASKAVARAAQPSAPKGDPDATSEWALWGEDDRWGEWVMEQIQDVSLVKPILDWKSRALYGNGLIYGLSTMENGEEKFTRLRDHEIDEWMEQTDITNYLIEAASYFYHFYNIYPELTLSNNRAKVAFIQCLETLDCRWKQRNSSGLLEECYYNANLRQPSGRLNDKHLQKIDVINTNRDPVQFVEGGKANKYVYPVSYASPGRYYYQEAPWHVLLNTWLPVARAIPKFKAQMMSNQIALRYLVHMPDWYITTHYPDFNTYNQKKKEQILATEHSRFDKWLTSDKNAGKSLLVQSKTEKPHEKYKDWKIEEISGKSLDGKYIEDSQEADAHIFKNLQVDPTLFGSGPGKNTMSSGSGSDKRVAWNTYVLSIKPHQDLILKPLHFVARYNGWMARLAKENNARLEFRFDNYRVARLDSGGEVQSSNGKKGAET